MGALPSRRPPADQKGRPGQNESNQQAFLLHVFTPAGIPPGERPSEPRYGSRTIGDRQAANFCADGFNTFTWQV